MADRGSQPQQNEFPESLEDSPFGVDIEPPEEVEREGAETPEPIEADGYEPAEQPDPVDFTNREPAEQPEPVPTVEYEGINGLVPETPMEQERGEAVPPEPPDVSRDPPPPLRLRFPDGPQTANTYWR